MKKKDGAKILCCEDGYPIIAAFRTDKYHLVFQCPSCGAHNVHGVGGKGVPFGYGDGHRRPHCMHSSRKWESCEFKKGYIIQEVDDPVLAGLDGRKYKKIS